MTARTPKSVSWWEPRWSFVPRIRHEFRIPLRKWIRIFVVSGLVTVLLAVIVRACLPNLPFNWFLNFLYAVAATVGYLVIARWFYSILPPHVTLHRKGITVVHGNNATCFRNTAIKAVNLVFHDARRIRMWITIEKLSRHVGVSPKVNFSTVAALLGDKLTVHDRRSHILLDDTNRDDFGLAVDEPKMVDSEHD
jgi:hypothetical protein